MFGQFFVEPVLEPEDEPEEPEEPEVPVLGLELELELEPVLSDPELEVVVRVGDQRAADHEAGGQGADGQRIANMSLHGLWPFRLVMHPPIGRATDTMSRQPWDARRMP
jgi:hypothetical protein